MKKLNGLMVALVTTLLMSACANFNGLSENSMGMLLVIRTDGQQLTMPQYEAVVAVAKEVSVSIGMQMSSPLESGLVGAGTGALPGSFDSVGASYGGAGIVAGFATYSYARVFALAESVEVTLRDREAMGQDIFKWVHVVASFVRSGNTELVPATPRMLEMLK